MSDDIKCVRCKSDNIIISNIDGYECDDCNAWFDIGDDGEIIFAYDHLPGIIMV